MLRLHETDAERRARRNAQAELSRARALAAMDGNESHPSHGTVYRYRCGCRCDRCRAVVARRRMELYNRQRDDSKRARTEMRRSMARAIANGASPSSVRSEYRADEMDVSAAREMARRMLAKER